MKKLIVLISAAFLTVTVMGQNAKNHSGFFNQVSKQKQLSIPGINDNFLNLHHQNKSAQKLTHLKEANGLKQRLDSVVVPGIEKDDYFYDSSGNMIRDTYFEWNGQWVKSSEDEYSYDEYGNQIQNISAEWDGSQWLNTYKDEYSYDSKGNQIKNVSYEWDGGNWLNSYKTESAYDNNNNLTQTIFYYGSGSSDNTFTASSKNEYSYDSNGNKTQNIQSNWYNDMWENSSKTEYVFSDNEIITQIFKYMWEGDNWTTLEKYEYVYDTNQNISEFVYYDYSGLEWVIAAKFEYQYDVKGNMILSKLIYLFEDQQIVFFKEELVYDDYDNTISYSIYGIDDESEDFSITPLWKGEYEYDNNFSFEDLILPFKSSDFDIESENDFDRELGYLDLNQMFKHKLIRMNYYEGNGVEWMISGDFSIYYSEQNITGVDDLNATNSVIVYPNPATDQVNFNLNASVNQFKAEFYNIQGELVMSKISENNRPVSIESLNKGLYFYRLSEKQNSYTGKFVVK